MRTKEWNCRIASEESNENVWFFVFCGDGGCATINDAKSSIDIYLASLAATCAYQPGPTENSHFICVRLARLARLVLMPADANHAIRICVEYLSHTHVSSCPNNDIAFKCRHIVKCISRRCLPFAAAAKQYRHSRSRSDIPNRRRRRLCRIEYKSCIRFLHFALGLFFLWIFRHPRLPSPPPPPRTHTMTK